MPKSSVVYARVSTAEQAAVGRHSLDAQEALCRRYAEAEGYRVIEAIRDEGYSGRTTQRPGLKRLLEYTGSTPPESINAILVQDTSRMGRDTTEYLLFRRELRQRGIELIAVTQPNIDASPEGRLVDTILAGINQYQSEEKGRRVLIAMHKKFDEGWWPAKAPLGYLNVEHDGRRLIDTDPERFSLVQLAFAEYATGHYTQQELQKFLAKRGLRDRDGRPICRGSLNKLLANPFYRGFLRWDGRERAGRHTPATDRRTWERCQAITAAHNHYVSRSRKHTFLLSGLTLCDACGLHHTRTVNHRKHKRYYHCPSRARCTQPYIPEDVLADDVASAVHRVHLSEPFIESVVEHVREVFDSRAAIHEHETSQLLRRRTVAEQKRDTAEQKLLAGVLSDAAFRRLMPRLAAELDEINEGLEAHEADRRLNTDTLREILHLARDIPRAYDEAPPTLQRRYLEFFFQSFIVRDRRIVRVVPTEFFQAMLPAGLVRTRAIWQPTVNAIRTVISALLSHTWLDKQRELMRDAARPAA